MVFSKYQAAPETVAGAFFDSAARVEKSDDDEDATEDDDTKQFMEEWPSGLRQMI